MWYEKVTGMKKESQRACVILSLGFFKAELQRIEMGFPGSLT